MNLYSIIIYIVDGKEYDSVKKIYTCIDISSDTIRILVSEYYQK